jgi:RNA polymerase sigma-70 factor (ECF subfamily)
MSVSDSAAVRAEAYPGPEDAQGSRRGGMSVKIGLAPPPPDSSPPPMETLESIYREHYRFVWRSAMRMGVPRDQVEDAVQDVFVVVSERLDTFEGRSSLRTWLFAILFRVASERRRKDAKAQRREAPAVSAPLAADETLARKQAAELFTQMLDELDADQRAIFVLFEIDRTPAKEIAEALGLNVNTVYSRLRLARKKMNRSLARFKAQDSGDSPRRTGSLVKRTS